MQVHPGDEYAREHHESRGKTEMWHILRAEPDSQVALGLRETGKHSAIERGREAAISGEIMEIARLDSRAAGDTFFIPAGTIHAIGGGIALCEVQQHSDFTYRLYDYGRARELHVEHAIAVAHLEPREGMVKPELLVDCLYFQTERLAVDGHWSCASPRRSTLYVVLEGEGLFAGQPFGAGEAWEVEAGSEPFEIAGKAVFLITATPGNLP